MVTGFAKAKEVTSLTYPYKYPEVYAELARQGRDKKEIANALGITLAGLRYKQSKETTGDFSATEMKKVAALLKKPIAKLFQLEPSNDNNG